LKHYPPTAVGREEQKKIQRDERQRTERTRRIAARLARVIAVMDAEAFGSGTSVTLTLSSRGMWLSEGFRNVNCMVLDVA